MVSAGRGQGRMAVRVLDELDLGKLMMLVHQVNFLSSRRPQFHSKTVDRGMNTRVLALILILISAYFTPLLQTEQGHLER